METGSGRPQKEGEGTPEKTEFKFDFPNYRGSTFRTTERQSGQIAVDRIAEIRQSDFAPAVRLSELLIYFARGIPPLWEGNRFQVDELLAKRNAGSGAPAPETFA